MKRLTLWTFAALAAIVAVFFAVIAFNTAQSTSRQPQVEPVALPDVDAFAVADLLARAIRIRTVATEHGVVDEDEVLLLHHFLEGSLPRTHRALTREKVGLSLLYTWKGSDSSLEPIVLMGHMDVVPVAEGSEDLWTWPPFAGVVHDGTVWGRGALDNKQNVIGLLAAVEHLVADGFRPKRTIYLSFGHDEEVGGAGAKAVAEHLRSRGIRAWMVLDEGGAILDGIIDGLPAPAAVIGVAEKGYMTVDLVVEGEGGHSSMPPRHSAVGKVARAVTRLEANPRPATVVGPNSRMYDFLGPEMPLPNRAILANRWLFGPLLVSRFSKKPNLDAALRTTTAATMLRAGEKENVLPTHAQATVNFRILPGETTQDVLEHIKVTVADPDVAIVKRQPISEPSPISPVDSEPFALLQRSIRQAFPGTIVAPYIMLGATDARFFTEISDHVFRFTPMTLEPGDTERIHGTNERIGVDDLTDVVRYYVVLIGNAAG